MSKIYVITAGDYSDYTIYGVTTDPVRAKDMRDKLDAYFGSKETVEIEEYEDGKFENESIDSYIPTKYYRVTARTGSDEVMVYDYMDNDRQVMNVSLYKGTGPWEISPNGVPIREVYTQYIVKGIKAEDEEHAVKIAIDEITKYRVEKGELGQ